MASHRVQQCWRVWRCGGCWDACCYRRLRAAVACTHSTHTHTHRPFGSLPLLAIHLSSCIRLVVAPMHSLHTWHPNHNDQFAFLSRI